MVAKNHFKFTSKALETLPIPTSKRSFYYDLKARGLALYITATGVKTFFVYRRVHGKPERIIIGRLNEVTLEQARAKANGINAQIAEGKNPQEAKRAIRQDLTLGELWKIYLERHAKICRSSWRNDAALNRLHLKRWMNRKLLHITTQDIQNLHRKIGRNNGTVTANHVHALLSLMFNKAIEWGWKNTNPAYGVKEPCETVRDYIYMSLFTGARRSNVQAMRWEQTPALSKIIDTSAA